MHILYIFEYILFKNTKIYKNLYVLYAYTVKDISYSIKYFVILLGLIFRRSCN